MQESADRRRALEASWHDNAALWTRAVRDGVIESRRLATDAAILDAVCRSHPRKVLDLGCGEGWLVRALAERGVEAVGIDGSAPLIDAARQGGGTFIRLGYDELTANPASCGSGYDVIVANFALLHEDLTPLLAALHRILNGQGKLLIQTLHPLAADAPYEDGWRREEFAGWDGSWTPMPWYFRTLQSWVRSLRDGGFVLHDLAEPRHPEDGHPLSLLLEAGPR